MMLILVVFASKAESWDASRSKSSQHFIVYWQEGFGADPSTCTNTIGNMSCTVDIDELLAKAEQFYDTEVNKLGMANVGNGKSQLETRKMKIYLMYTSDWTANGGGEDNYTGALWVNPAACNPIGSTIAHEIGHAFQFQVYCDYLLTHPGSNVLGGWRYGFGNNGAGGCAIWEACANFQSYQDYPDQVFGNYANVREWLNNYHRHVFNEQMRYASYYWWYYLVEKHGYKAYGNLWNSSYYPEDPLETYQRLYCDNRLDNLWKDYFAYAQRLPNYQFAPIHNYVIKDALNYNVTYYKNGDYLQVAYASCPGTSGVNITPLNVPAAGTTITANFAGIAPGSALASGDPGTAITEYYSFDRTSPSTTVTTYNKVGTDSEAGWRYGFVAVNDQDESLYSEMFSDRNGTASYTIPAGTKRLYFVVVGAPSTYHRHYWNEGAGVGETDDYQWPYKVKFGNTNPIGYSEPKNTTIDYTATGDGTSSDFVLGTFSLSESGILAQVAAAFDMNEGDVKSLLQSISAGSTSTPSEGKISFGLLQPDNSYTYTYTANSGFWTNDAGYSVTWGNNQSVYLEIDKSTMTATYGHMGNGGAKNITLHPVFAYTKNGKTYYAILNLHLVYTNGKTVTGISQIMDESTSSSAVYTLSGKQAVTDKGILIIKGKKYIKK